MAHQHVFLVQDEAIELSSLKDRSKAQKGGEEDVAERLLAKIVDFSHPRTDTVREYFQSKTDSPNTKKRRLDVEERKSEALLVEAKARAEGVSLMRGILANSQESPMCKQRRHQLEAPDAATRAADAQTRATATRRHEIEARGRETKAVVDVQKSVMDMVSEMMEKFNGDFSFLADDVVEGSC